MFAVDRDERGRRAWLRLWSGEVQVRDRLRIGDGLARALVTEVAVSEPGGVTVRRTAAAGQIVALRGPGARIGDTLGRPPRRRTHRFPPATIQALVEPVDPTQRGALFAGLTELAEEDPLIDLRLDEVEGEAALSLHGEVQKEVVGRAARGAVRGPRAVRADARRSASNGSSAQARRSISSGSAATPTSPVSGCASTLSPVGHGVAFRPGRRARATCRPAFVAATEEGVRNGLRQGLHGWEVTDCVVTMTASAYCPGRAGRTRSSTSRSRRWPATSGTSRRSS